MSKQDILAEELMKEDLKEIELSRKEIQEGKYITLKELERSGRYNHV